MERIEDIEFLQPVEVGQIMLVTAEIRSTLVQTQYNFNNKTLISNFIPQ